MLIGAVIPNDHLKGLQLGLKFCEIVADTPSRSFSPMSSVVGLMLFPTIFDAERWLPESGLTEAHNGTEPASDENLGSISAMAFDPASALLQRQKLVREWVDRNTMAAGGIPTDRTEAVKRLKSLAGKETNQEREGCPAGIDEKKDIALKGVVDKTKKCLDMINLDM